MQLNQYTPQGRPQDLAGGGQEFFFQIWKFACVANSDMLRMAKPYALLGGSGACSPEKIFLNEAIWCVLVYILIRFCL